MGDVALPTSEEIVQANDFVALAEEAFAKMGA